jgi:hypothetical protein
MLKRGRQHHSDDIGRQHRFAADRDGDPAEHEQHQQDELELAR